MASGNARSFLSKLPFEAKDIPKFNVHDDQVKNYLKKGQPIVIADSGLCKTALRWDLEFLEEHMGGKHYVHFSDTPSFMYFDEKKMVHYPDFKPPTQRRDMSFSSFCKTFRELKDSTSQYIYYQQQLTDTVDSEIKQDFIKFNWQWLNEQKRTYNFGDLTSNLLLISHPGNYTPCHYDEQQNFFTMNRGYKRCILFPPRDFECLYPYPVAHPCDRQSQVDILNPDYERFPNFKNAHPHECVLGPGEVLYIPMYWWHYIESVGKDYTMSITFWYLAGPQPTKIEYPLLPVHKVSMTRNIEKMLGTALGDPREVGPFLRMIVNGRYDVPPDPTSKETS